MSAADRDEKLQDMGYTPEAIDPSGGKGGGPRRNRAHILLEYPGLREQLRGNQSLRKNILDAMAQDFKVAAKQARHQAKAGAEAYAARATWLGIVIVAETDIKRAEELAAAGGWRKPGRGR